MKVSGIPPRDLYQQYINTAKRSTVYSPVAAKTDQVHITNEAKSFSSILKAARESMEVNQADRVSQLKAQIESHSYYVPGVKVAEKILGLE